MSRRAPSKPSVWFVVVDGRGAQLARLDAIEKATLASRQIPGAVAIVSSPSGVLMARVSRGIATAKNDALAKFAARRWLQAAAE